MPETRSLPGKAGESPWPGTEPPGGVFELPVGGLGGGRKEEAGVEESSISAVVGTARTLWWLPRRRASHDGRLCRSPARGQPGWKPDQVPGFLERPVALGPAAGGLADVGSEQRLASDRGSARLSARRPRGRVGLEDRLDGSGSAATSPSTRRPRSSSRWPAMTSSLPPITAKDPPPFTCVTVQKSIDFRQTLAELAAEESETVRGLTMAQRRHEGFGQKLHVQKADCQPAAKGAANAAIEVSFQDRSKSAERPRRPSSYLSTGRYSSEALNFAAHSREAARQKIPPCSPLGYAAGSSSP